MQVRSGAVGAPKSNAEQPGRYYVRVTADGIGTAELPVELVVSVAEPATAASTTAVTIAALPPGQTVAAPPTDGGVLTPILLGVIGVLAVMVIGLGIAVVVMLRRIRR